MNLTLTNGAHSSEIVEACRIPVQGRYLEDCWLPIVGPSTVLLTRIAHRLATEGGGRAVVPSSELAGMLGLGRRDAESPSSAFGRTLHRARQFGLAQWDADRGLFKAYDHVAPVPTRRLGLLASRNLSLHAEEMAAVAARLATEGRPDVAQDAYRRIDAAQRAALRDGAQASPAADGRRTLSTGERDAALRSVAALDRLRQGPTEPGVTPPSPGI